MFRSRKLSPKLHRWALGLVKDDIVLKGKAGATYHLPDTLSCLPHVPTPQPDADESFLDAFTSTSRATYGGPNGPVL